MVGKHWFGKKEYEKAQYILKLIRYNMASQYVDFSAMNQTALIVMGQSLSLSHKTRAPD